MKKLVVSISILFLFTCFLGTASAFFVPWNMDISTVDLDSNKGQILNIGNDIGFSTISPSPTDVTQYLGSDGILNNGDSFSEFGFLNQVDIDGTSITFEDADTEAERFVYLEFSGLTGFISEYENPDGTDTTISNYKDDNSIINDDIFNLNFDPGVGDIKLYVDDNLNSGDGTLGTLASYSLLDGGGNAPQLKVGGTANSPLSFELNYTGVQPNTWSFTDGTLFEDWLTTYGIGSIKASLTLNAETVSRGTIDTNSDSVDDAFSFGIANNGDYKTNQVPEPTTMLLFGTGLIGLACFGRKRFIKRA